MKCTHSEMTQLFPAPAGVGFSACPGNMVESPLSEAMRRQVDGHRVRRRTELYSCELCHYTIVMEVDDRNVRRIRNGYPAPAIHAAKPAHLN